MQRKERLTALGGVAVLHVLFAWVLLLGLAPDLFRQSEKRLALFDIAPAPVPPPVLRPEPRPRTPRRTEGAAAPANLRAEPKPIIVPTPKIQVETRQPVRASVVAGSGTRVSAGAAETPGPGTGAGGEGRGRGSGFSGGGTGGPVVVRARLRSGNILPRDYPRAANGQQGTVAARLTVGVSGIVTACTILRSSGNAVLDATTCRLIRERFRYAPARDAEGNAVPDFQGWQQRWWRE